MQKNLTPLGENIPLELLKEKEEIVLSLKEGEYSIHNCNIVHYSERNTSEFWRIGLIMRFTQYSALKESYQQAKNYRPLTKNQPSRATGISPIEISTTHVVSYYSCQNQREIIIDSLPMSI